MGNHMSSLSSLRALSLVSPFHLDSRRGIFPKAFLRRAPSLLLVTEWKCETPGQPVAVTL
jgi:hypothetical protein